MTKVFFILFLACCLQVQKNGSDYQTKAENFLKNQETCYLQRTTKSIFTWTLEKQSNFIWKKQVKLHAKDNDKSIDLFFYEYSANDQCQKAYQALLNCFPTECTKLTENNNIKAFKITPSIFIVNSKTITIANVKCEEQTDNWEMIKQALIDEFSNEESKIIITGCGGPLEWK